MRKIYTLIVLIFASLLSLPAISQVIIGSDNAGNYTEWTNGSNEGEGFGVWNLNTEIQEGGHASFFLGNSGTDGFGNINSNNDRAFGMYGNPGGGNYANASREILEWKNGYSFEINLAIAWTDGTKGIDLKNENNTIYSFYANSTGNNYKIYVNGSETNLGWSYDQYSIFHLHAIQYGNNLHVTLTRNSTKHTVVIPSTQLKSFHLFAGNGNSNALNNLYFNNLVLKRHVSVLFDDFNRGDNNEVGVPSSNPGGSWIETGEPLGVDNYIQINNNMLVMSNCASSGQQGSKSAAFDMSGLYNTIFEEADDVMEWYFNMRQSREDPSGFGSINYGVGFILGATEPDFSSSNLKGYAVVLGEPNDYHQNGKDPIRLIQFNNKITVEKNDANTIAKVSPTLNERNRYYSIKVTFNPCTSEWTLDVRDDGTSGFNDPTSNSGSFQSDSGYDSSLIDIELKYIGGYYNHNSTCTEDAYFDNIYIPTTGSLLPETYTWSGGSSASYQESTSWNPYRTCPRRTDKLIFDGGVYEIKEIPDQTINQLHVINGSQVTLRDLSTDTLPSVITIKKHSSSAGYDFFIDETSSLILDVSENNHKNDAIEISLLDGVKGKIDGNLIFQNTVSSAGRSHRLLAKDMNAIEVYGVIDAVNFMGNPFGNTGAEHVIVFKTGSKYIHRGTGAHVFGFSNNAKSKVLFQEGSWFDYYSNDEPTISGRTYANFKYNPSGGLSPKNLKGGSAYFIDTLVVLNGGLNFQLTTTGTIKGDIEVASGATLNFTPPSGKSSTIVLNSDVPQNIYGGGTLKFGNGATLKIQNEEKVSIQKNVTIETGGKAIVEAGGVIEFVNESYFDGGGETKIENNASIYIGSAQGITNTGNGNVRTSTRDYSDKAAYIYNGTVNQVTGDGLPKKLIGIGRLEIANTGSSGNNTITITKDSTRTPKLTLTSGLFEVGVGNNLQITGGGNIEATNGNFAVGNKAGSIHFMGAGSVNATGDLDFYDVEFFNNGGVNFGDEGSPTVHNILKINTGQWVQDHPPFYADGSTLFYSINGPFVAGSEWNANETSDRGVPYNVQIGQNNKGTNLSFAGANRYLKNNLSIGGSDGTANSSLTLLNFSESYLEVGGNFIVNSKGSFNPNGARVIFSGSSDQTITSHGAGNEVNFNYLTVNKSGGDLILDDNPGTTVNVNANSGSVLSLTQGDIELNGQTFKLGGNGGELKLESSTPTGPPRSIKSNKAANFIFTGEKEVVSQGIKLIFEDSVTVAITTSQSEPIGVDFGAGNPTEIKGTLRIDQNGFANVNAPFYGSQGILQYNTNGLYERRVEWQGKEGDPGFPNHVIIGGNTILAAGGYGGENVEKEFGAQLDVTIEHGSSLYMDYDQHHMKVPLKVGRDLIIHGNLSASGIGGGDIHVAGNWLRTSTGNFYPNDRQVLFNGTDSQTITAPGDGETFDYLGFDSTGTKTLDSDITVNKKLEIFENSGIVDANGKKITLEGHWENEAGADKFIPNNSTLELIGSTNQNIKAADNAVNFHNVIVNNTIEDKTQGITLENTDMNIFGNLTLTKGIIHTDNDRVVHFQETAKTSKGNDDSFINGKARKTGFEVDEIFIFPVGYLKDTIDVFQPAGIIPQGTSAEASFTVDYVHENYFPGTWVPNIPPPMGDDLATVSGCDYWNIDRTVGSINANVRLYWSEACFDISEPDDLVVAKVVNKGNEEDPDEEWISMGQSAVSPSDFDGQHYKSGWVESSIVNDFSPFAIASSNSINVLPIELISFNAFAKGDKVETTWVTSTEKNNAYFTVEKSLDARHFVEVGRVEGAGNSTSQNSYALTDNRPYSGISYYRLKQTDFDGSYTYSEIRSVRIDRDSKFELVKVYRSDFGLNLAYRSEAEVLDVEIFDLVGKKIYHSQINNNGFSTIHPNFARGVYLLRLSNGFETVTEKFFW